MFKSKLVSSNATTTSKLPRIDNVLINVVVVVTTRNQQLEQQVFKERELVKAKKVEEWQKKNIYKIRSLKLLDSYSIVITIAQWG